MEKELNFYGLATWLSVKFNMTDNEIVETFEEALKKVLEEEQKKTHKFLKCNKKLKCNMLYYRKDKQ